MVLLVALPALAAAPTHAQMQAAQWTAVTTKNHADAGTIEISRATIEGIECFRGTATVDVPAGKLLEVVTDVEGAVRWSSAGVTEAKLLARAGDTLEYYQYLDVPGWTMASDRFWFVRSTVQQGSKYTLQWSRLAEGGPHADTYRQVKTAHPDAVEPTVNVGGWYFEPVADGTRIAYEICTLPGGSIPTAVQNAATRTTLPDTVGDAVREARRR